MRAKSDVDELRLSGDKSWAVQLNVNNKMTTKSVRNVIGTLTGEEDPGKIIHTKSYTILDYAFNSNNYYHSLQAFKPA